MNWETLFSLGDSITIGARSYLGYPEYAAPILEEKTGRFWHIVNHATSGFTTADLGRSLTPLIPHYQSFKPGIVSLLIGTNDLKNGTSLDNFELAYNQVIIKARLISQNNNLILLTIPSFPKGVMYPYNINMNERVPEFNAVIQKLGKRHNLRVFSFELAEELLWDGVHLNEMGSRNFGNQLAGFILKDRGIEL